MTQVAVTDKQLKNMKHALGLDWNKRPYRNRYYTESNDADWNDLVNKGLAEKGGGWEPGMSYFKVTLEGAKLAYGKRMTRKFYDEL